MKRLCRAGLNLVLTLLFILNLSPPSIHAASTTGRLEQQISSTAQYLLDAVPTPGVGSNGGEWAILGLARSGQAVPEGYYQSYYDTLADYVGDCEGVLHTTKYTEYARVVLALSALGVDARTISGYDLTLPLGDYGQTIWQGINGPIYALLALDSRSYPMPQNPEAQTQATRQMYVDYILDCQLPDGGWSLSSSTADPDMTGMALQVLSKYRDQSAVQTAIDKALACMSGLQNGDGGFSSWEEANSESCAQMLAALCELGLDLQDPRFVKDGNTLLDGLLAYAQPGGGFLHIKSGVQSDQMATEQSFYALVALRRVQSGKSTLYSMDDAPVLVTVQGQSNVGLPDKHSDVKNHPITEPGKTFADIMGHPNQQAIEALAQRGLVSGKGNDCFDPDATMTRAEFSAIVVTSLGLLPQVDAVFSDVPENSWFAPYVGAAYRYSLVSGRGAGIFDPDGTITRQEAACMVSQAARLCGMDTQMADTAIRNMLAQFGDYTTSAQWARNALAFCYQEEILNQSALNIRPLQPITRSEIAQMIFNLLDRAKLL